MERGCADSEGFHAVGAGEGFLPDLLGYGAGRTGLAVGCGGGEKVVGAVAADLPFSGRFGQEFRE
ncbi:hypothetical protein [Streptomyces acidicola]|uniref:hypothetical protein n=1 Tax=Streptomyces acidicola TaxID=2596892 RepID=UPI0038017000